MTHDDLLHLLSRQLDGELTADEKNRLDAHLRESPEARTIAEAFRVQDRELE